MRVCLMYCLLLGSRAGGVIAACWATMRYFGKDRYVEFTKKIIDTSKFIEAK